VTELHLHSRLAELPRLAAAIEAFARANGLADATRHTLELVLEEVVTNAIRHGFEAGAEGEIHVRLARDPGGAVVATCSDPGRPFDPTRPPAPRSAAAPGGRGHALKPRLTDEIGYEREAGRNRVTLRWNPARR